MKLKQLSLATIAITFLLLVLGGIVHNTESSLACPDWPFVLWTGFSPYGGGILIEHSHRLLASLVGFLTIILTVLSYRMRKQSELHRQCFNLSSLALVFVIIQGILGGITVIYRLPTIVSTSHLGLSMVFFSTLILLHHKASSLGNMTPSELTTSNLRETWNPNLLNLVFFTTAMIYLQILLGAFMRHSGAGASCGLGWQSTIFCVDTSTWSSSFWPGFAPAQLHMAHRIFAALVGFLSLWTSYKIWISLRGAGLKGILTNAWWGAFTVFVQIFIGILTLANNLSVIPTTAHLAGELFCLALFWKLTLRIKSTQDHIFPEGVYTYLGDFVQLTKPKLSGLVIVTIFAGMLLAPGQIGFFKALFFLLLMALVVLGAAALNCYIEKDVDALMERTRMRALPAGRMRPTTALLFGIVLLVISILSLVIWVNFITAALAFTAAVLYLLAYTPMKQKSELAVYVGAVPGAIPPLMGWSAVTGGIEIMGWILFGILFIWQLPHFLAISMYYARDYGAANIKVYPNLKGAIKTKNFIFLFTVILGVVAVLPAYYGHASPAYKWAAITLSIGFILFSFYGYFVDRDEAVQRVWAKNYFFLSIFYLPLLLCAMLFLK